MAFDPNMLFDNGIAIAVIGWFMWRNEKKLSSLSKALGVQAKVMMLMVEKFGSRDAKSVEREGLKNDIDTIIKGNGG